MIIATAFRSVAAAFVTLVIATSVVSAQAMDTFFVSAKGRDGWSGRTSAPNAQLTDGPFASFEHARDVIRNRPDRGVRGAIVGVRGGLWLRSNSLVFGPADGGTLAHPVVWESFPGEVARIAGAVRLTKWIRARDPEVIARLPAAARGSVMVSHIPDGVRIGGWTSDGRSIRPAPPELIWNDTVLRIARWPNTGWDQIVGVDSARGVSIRVATDRLARWTTAPDAWVLGYWFWDWFASFLPLKGVDPQSHTLRLLGSPIYGIRAGQRYSVVNLLEELDTRGEYWIDEANRVVYVWPPSDPAKAEALLTVMTEPVMDISGSADFTLSGLVFEAARGIGVRIQGGERVTVEGGAIRSVGGRGIEMRSGAGNVIRDVKIEDVGEDGIWVSAGDRRTLTPSRHLIEHVQLSRYDRWVRTMAPGIRLFGVGTTIRDCEFSEAPESGVVLEGNDHVIERNTFHHLLLETRDAGAIDIGRDWTARGNVIRGNYFYALGPREAWRTPLKLQAIYLDDMASGMTIEDNVFDHAQVAITIGGGRDNVIERNVIIQSDTAIFMAAQGRNWIRSAGRPGSTWDYLVRLLKEARPDSSPYAEHFPKLKTVLTDQPGEPIGNIFVDNVIVGGTGIHLDVAPVIPRESGTVRIPSVDSGVWGRERLQSFLDSLAKAGVRHRQLLPKPIVELHH